MVAEHCGYRPLEMNASDDRSVDALRDIVGRAVTTNTLDKDKRPNCIIMDEIDGIDGRAPIDALVNIIKTPLSVDKKGKRSNSDTTGGKGSLALTRPLICICNDLFSPQLRELRKLAQVIIFFILYHFPSDAVIFSGIYFYKPNGDEVDSTAKKC